MRREIGLRKEKKRSARRDARSQLPDTEAGGWKERVKVDRQTQSIVERLSLTPMNSVPELSTFNGRRCTFVVALLLYSYGITASLSLQVADGPLTTPISQAGSNFAKTLLRSLIAPSYVGGKVYLMSARTLLGRALRTVKPSCL